MRLSSPEYDAVIVGSGPNGFAAAITLQRAGLSILLIEAKNTIGGGLRSAELTLPHYIHDVCSAAHPLAVTSPFFKTLPLHEHGLEFIDSPVICAHPFDDGDAAALFRSVEDTAHSLHEDEHTYLKLIKPIVRDWPRIEDDALGPLHFPRHPGEMVRFGLKAIHPATKIARRFKSKGARGLWAGISAHSIQPLTSAATSATALVLITAGHLNGWPIARQGSQSIAMALGSYFISLGGVIETGFHIHSLKQIPPCDAILFDTSPRQLLQVDGIHFSSFYKWQLSRYRYGMGVFKMDWALDGPIPFTSEVCRKSGTVHLGNTLEEIVASEQLTSQGKHPGKPFVLLVQPSLFDDTRAPAGAHTAWAYCHVPNGSEINMTDQIEQQVERFAPGFRKRIMARHIMNTRQIEEYNPNYIGGDIIGGAMNLGQLFTRPAVRLSPYSTSAKGIYLCSSSTPPGGGVHGMCGYHAAHRVMKDIFDKKAKVALKMDRGRGES